MTGSRKPDRSYEERKRISTFGDFPGIYHPSTKTYKMKVIGLVTLVVSLSAIIGCGPGVATQDPASGNPIEATTVTDGNKNTATPVANVSSSGLNPAHGVPGHRCDIAVGQPLNSKPAPSTGLNPITTATTPATPTPQTPAAPFVNPDAKTVTNPVSTIAPTTQPASGLNPKHGQPGHRCDIPVGKPLNSKPTLPASPTTPVQNTTPTASPLAPLASPSITPGTSTTDVAPGMNPKHGQPGHRCDIPVGSPLSARLKK